ncbi:MAG TPA: VWA domain-containing protein [Acidobacteriota bacterium]|nr:VWA domain-containing protein [Acidobacteriota bacterium]
MFASDSTRNDFQRHARCAIMLSVLIFPFSQRPSDLAQGQTGRTQTIRVQVDLVTIEVAAQDRMGKPVLNLKKEDLRLYEDGKQQEIATFDTVNCDGQAQSYSRRSDSFGDSSRSKIVLIVFGDGGTAPWELKTVRDAAETYVRRNMRPSDWMGVAVYWRSLTITQNFTQDPAKVIEAIRKPAASSDTSPGSTVSIGQNLGLNFLRSLIPLTASLEPTKGRKAIMIFSNDFPHPSVQHFEKLLETARKANVSFYTLTPRRASAGGGKPRASNEAPVRAPDQKGNGRGSLRLGAASAPLSFNGGGQVTSQPPGTVPLSPEQRPQEPYAGDCLRSLSEATGGGFVQESSDLTAAMDSFNQELCQYYLLGFQSTNPRPDGRLHKIEVKTGIKGVRLKYRSGYYDSRPVDALAGTKDERPLLGALSAPAPATQLPLAFRPFYFYDGPQEARIPIYGRIRRGSSEPGDKAARSRSTVDLMGVAYAEDGRVVARFSRTLNPDSDPGRQGTNLDRDIAFSSYMKLRPGKYQLKLVASDSRAGIGTAVQDLIVPAFPPSGIAVSSLVVSQRVEPLPELIRDMQASLLNETDPLVYRGHQISASVDNTFSRQKPLLILYRIYSLNVEEANRSLIAEVRLLDEKGETVLSRSIRLNKVAQSGQHGDLIIGFSLPVTDTQPGKYRLHVETVEVTTRQSVACETQIVLE